MQTPSASDAPPWVGRVRAFIAAATIDGRSSDQSGAIYACALCLVTCASLWIVREPGSGWRTVGSYLLQQALLWGSFWMVDDRLQHGLHRGVWATLGTLGAALVVLDALLLRMTSLPLREILPMLLASQHVAEGLREIGLKPLRLIALGTALVAAAISGGSLRLLLAQLLPRRARATRQNARWAMLSLLAAGFWTEQTLARESPDYLYRAVRMPLYAQLYSTSSQSVELALPPPVEHTTRERWLRDVSRARTPKHVLYVLLESFRADALEPEAAPAMWQLAQQSRWYTHALAEATYTPLSWSVLLFDETASDNLFGRHSGRPEPLGGYLFALMDHASIQPHLFASTNLSYAKTRQRLLGAHGKLDLFQAAADVGEDPFDKNHNDRLVVDHAVDFIRTQSWSEPQLMMLQLDSTHYTYPFPEDDAVFTPYSENLMLPRPIETDEEARLLRNRYRNAVHFVDAQLARVMHALKDAGVYDDMLIVLTADHGEGLAPGLQGHAAVAEVTKRVPLLIRVPGQPAERIDTLVSHRDVLPTLTGLLGIDVPAGTLRGAPLEARATDNAVFTLAPSGRFGQLTLPDYVVDLRLVYRATSVIVTPAAIHGPDDAATRTRAEREWVQRLSEFLQVSPTARAVVEASASAQN